MEVYAQRINYQRYLKDNNDELNILCPVSVLPDLNEDNGRMEAVKDEKRQSQTGNDSPGKESVEGKLQFLSHPIMRHERV